MASEVVETATLQVGRGRHRELGQNPATKREESSTANLEHLPSQPSDEEMPFSPDEMVRASELKDFLYCQRAWFLNQRGFRASEESALEREAGNAFHEERATAARKGSKKSTLWLAFISVLLAAVLLLLRSLSKSG